ncbi:STAS domain-containing protein [Nonomuraea zeae]|uniref:STAS domain-containing protein n=1 Tax=Nonomuraea zeae TaxID=1642303 RepID=A0A5S4G2C0_9ACTN|nr:STAS domain-containing protein [Nonomuraea zeae]
MSADELAVHTECGETVLVVRLEGELVWPAAPGLSTRVQASLPTGPAATVLDMSWARFLDSSGVAALLALYQSLAEAQAVVAFARSTPLIERLLTIAGLHDHLPLYDTLEAARRADGCLLVEVAQHGHQLVHGERSSLVDGEPGFGTGADGRPAGRRARLEAGHSGASGCHTSPAQEVPAVSRRTHPARRPGGACAWAGQRSGARCPTARSGGCPS